MMSFELTQEQEMLRKSIREFAEGEIKPRAIEMDEKERFDTGLVGKMGEMGLFGMFVDEKYGGSHAGYLSYIIAVEEIARVDGSPPRRRSPPATRSGSVRSTTSAARSRSGRFSRSSAPARRSRGSA